MIIHKGKTYDPIEDKLHPNLKEIYSDQTPTIVHNEDVIQGAEECIKYIDDTFGEPSYLYPEDGKKRKLID